MTDVNQEDGGFRPPYFSFSTFWSFVAELASRPLPPRIDRSLMNSKSGTDQVNLLSALKAFDLITADHGVTDRLRALTVPDESERKSALLEMLREFYPDQIALSDQNGTEQQLKESFRTSFKIDSVDTVRKAITFFLHGARIAGLTLSPHFPTTRSGSGAPGAPKGKRSTTSRQKSTQHGDGTAKQGEKPPSGEHRVVSLGEAGTVSINVDVRWLDLPDETFKKLRELIKDIEALSQAAETTPAAPTA
jgi:hypothetical protein